MRLHAPSDGTAVVSSSVRDAGGKTRCMSQGGASYGRGEGGLAGQQVSIREVAGDSEGGWPTSPLHHCTARPQKKPRQGDGAKSGYIKWWPAAGPEANASAANPLTQRGRRLTGCTPRGGRPHEKAPPSSGAKAIFQRGACPSEANPTMAIAQSVAQCTICTSMSRLAGHLVLADAEVAIPRR